MTLQINPAPSFQGSEPSFGMQPKGTWLHGVSISSGEAVLIYKGLNLGYLVLYEKTKHPFVANTPWTLYRDVKKLEKGASFTLSYTI